MTNLIFLPLLLFVSRQCSLYDDFCGSGAVTQVLVVVLLLVVVVGVVLVGVVPPPVAVVAAHAVDAVWQ